MSNYKSYVRKNGGIFNADYLLEIIQWAKKINWDKTQWKSQQALVEKKGGKIALYTGQKYDPEYFNLIEDAWSHDHCEICSQRIENNDIAYQCENEIICSDCYLEFVLPENIEEEIKKNCS